MFGNFSLPELLIVGAIALIVIGPKDLPRMMRSVGKFVGQARGLARQFQDSMNEAAREADIDEFREARKMLSGKTSTKGITDALNDTVDMDGAKDKKPRSPVLSEEEQRQVSKDLGFGKDKSDKSEPVMEPFDTASPDTAKAADTRQADA